MKVDSMVTCDFCGTNDFLTDDDPPEGWEGMEDHDLCPGCLGNIKRGVADVKAGRVTPFREEAE